MHVREWKGKLVDLVFRDAGVFGFADDYVGQMLIPSWYRLRCLENKTKLNSYSFKGFIFY